ncbi:Shedu immune nuclease family protein [Actinosynnema sp. NPDC004786]
MGYRSGFTLVRLLEDTREMTRSAEVRDCVDAALRFINSGTDSRGRGYQRGKDLVNHLKRGSLAASGAGEDKVSDRLADFAEYAAGDIPLTLLETWYVPGAQHWGENLARLTLEQGLRRAVELLGEFLKDRPDATAAQARQWLRRLTSSMERWTIGEDRLGGVRLPRGSADHLVWLSRIQLILTDPPAGAELPDLSPEALEEIAGMPGSEVVARAIQWRRRRTALDRLRAVVEDPGSSERRIHEELKEQTWIFGGRYVEELDRRRFTTTDEVDIPLLRGDGSLHVVELKRAFVPRLVEKPRSHCSVGADVHEAMTQAANYLRSLDEQRATILAEHGIETRRAFATVLIGHPAFVTPAFEPAEVAAAFRSYNAVLSRIEVLTYQDLIDAAERTLALDQDDIVAG